MDGGTLQTSASVIQKEARRSGPGQELRAPLGVVGEHGARGSMQRNQPRFVELRLPNEQETFLQIHVALLQPYDFTQPQPADGQQPKQAAIGPRSQTIPGRQVLRDRQQLLDLLVRVQVRTGALRSKWYQSRRRNLRARIG